MFKTIYSYTRDDIRAPIPELPSESYPWWAGRVINDRLIWKGLTRNDKQKLNKGFTYATSILSIPFARLDR
ncbi:MAG: hypothetical protein QNJ58_25875 [Desulfobacterales bacterium]|nr:hypothetical protein [Desulfobacterales bacterium]